MTSSTISDSCWSRVGDLAPSSLTDARLRLHHAAQIVVSAAISYLPATSDDSHTALTWSRSNRALVSEPIPAGQALRIGLRTEDLVLLTFNGGGAETSSFGLSGQTTRQAYAWLAAAAVGAGLDSERLSAKKHYTIAHHPVASGSAFLLGDGAAFQELTRYWSNAAAVLDDMAASTPGASDVRTWPHHFDIATLCSLPG